jgi:undecaprenyl-diphosphatase
VVNLQNRRCPRKLAAKGVELLLPSPANPVDRRQTRKKSDLMQNLDTALFLWTTGGPESSEWIIATARMMATGIVPLVAAALLVAWVRAGRDWRPVLLDAVAAGLLGLAAVQIIGFLHYRPRPFEAGLGANLLQHLPENSFPSDHATLMFALAFAVLASVGLRKAGAALLLLAFAVSWARVFLGAHYPSDILGGAILGLGSVAVIRSLNWRRGLWGAITGLYEAFLTTLHLPPGVFPRGR